MVNDDYKNNVDVLTLQEMRWIGTRIMDEGRHVIFYSGHHKKHEFGVGFLVNNRIKDSIIGFIPINHMLCIARIAGIFFNYSIINAHAPVEDADDEEKDDFYDALAKAYKECPRHDIKVLVRDMNAQVGRDSICEPNIGRHDLCDDTNGDGSHVVDFALTHNLVGRTLFIPKKIHKGSRRTPNGNAINQIDRTLTDARRQVRSAACESI
jgi:exonuclease III